MRTRRPRPFRNPRQQVTGPSLNPKAWRTVSLARTSVNGGGKVDHMGGSIVGLRLS